MGKQQVDECTKKFQQRWKNSKRGCEYYEEGRQREVKATKQHKLLKDQERENVEDGGKKMFREYVHNESRVF